MAEILPRRQHRARILRDMSPVVLMGRGHSGTRVLAWICTHLGIHLGTHTDRETGDSNDLVFTRQIKKIAIRNIGNHRVDQVRSRDLARFQKAVYRHYIAQGRPEPPWGWKFPETYLIAPCVHLTFPRARYLHLVRDGRDLAFKHHLTDDPRRTLGRRLLKHIGAIEDPPHLQAARSWAFQVETYAAFRDDTPGLRVHDLRFEDLIRDPIPSVESVCRFLDIPFRPEALEWIETNIRQGKIRQHRDQCPEQLRDVEAAIGRTLLRFGYGETGPAGSVFRTDA